MVTALQNMHKNKALIAETQPSKTPHPDSTHCAQRQFNISPTVLTSLTVPAYPELRNATQSFLHKLCQHQPHQKLGLPQVANESNPSSIWGSSRHDYFLLIIIPLYDGVSMLLTIFPYAVLEIEVS